MGKRWQANGRSAKTGCSDPAAPKSTPTIARRKTDAPMALVRGEKTKKTTPSEPERRRVSNDQQDCGPVPPEFRVFSPSQILPLAGRIFMHFMCRVKRQFARRQDRRSGLTGKNASALVIFRGFGPGWRQVPPVERILSSANMFSYLNE